MSKTVSETDIVLVYDDMYLERVSDLLEETDEVYGILPSVQLYRPTEFELASSG